MVDPETGFQQQQHQQQQQQQNQQQHQKQLQDNNTENGSSLLSSSSPPCSMNGPILSSDVGPTLPLVRKQSTTTLAPSTTTATNALTRQGSKKKFMPKLVHPFLNIIPIQIRFAICGSIGNIIFIVVYNNMLYYLGQKHLMISLFVFGWPEHYWSSLISNFHIGITGMMLGSGLTAYLNYTQLKGTIAYIIQTYIVQRFRHGLQLLLTPSSLSATVKSFLFGSSNTVASQIPPSPGSAGGVGDPSLGGVMQNGAKPLKAVTMNPIMTNGAVVDHRELNVMAATTAADREFYTSIVVLVVTSLWTYFLTVFVNTPAPSARKKEL